MCISFWRSNACYYVHISGCSADVCTSDLVGDLIYSGDPNVRRTAGVIGADGALYISDWQNTLSGHIQHNVRDPKRDHEHGRIYRITAAGRPLAEPVAIAGEPVEKLLDLLQHPVNEVRHQVQIELNARDREEVISKAKEWVKQFDASDEAGAHAMLNRKSTSLNYSH